MSDLTKHSPRYFLIISLIISQCSVTTCTKQVIDIFTNYPNTQEVLEDYNRLLESRQLDDDVQARIKPPDSSDFLTKNSKTTEVPNEILLSKVSGDFGNTGEVIKPSKNSVARGENHKKVNNLPRIIAAKSSTPIELETRMRDRVSFNGGYNYHGPRDDHFETGNKRQNGYWGDLYDIKNNFYQSNHKYHHTTDSDLLESEFGTFERPDVHNPYGGDLQAQASINHLMQPGGGSNNLLDLNGFVEVMATRPTFLTDGSTLSAGLTVDGYKNRRNKTLLFTHGPDYVDFDVQDVENSDDQGHGQDVLESDFGEIVSTTVDRNKHRKGNVKRIPKPAKHKGAVNKHHIAHLTAEVSKGGKAKVTNLIRKYLTKMRDGGAKQSNGLRRNRKQNNQNDRTFNFLADDKKTELQTDVTLHEGAEKFLLGHDYGGPLATFKNKTKLIASKFLSLFTVVQFANFRCRANSAVSQYEGTCVLASECAERNGQAMGMCAEGHGVCCVFRGTCGGVGSNNCTYFESPGYPNYFPQDGGVVLPTSTTSNPLTPDPRFPLSQFLSAESRQSESANALSCIFKVYKASNNVKQMRIDFIDLELAGPTNGICVNEQLIISGTGLTSSVPVICGYNTGQHVLVDVTNLSGPLQFAVLANAINRKRYKLRICQYSDGCSGLMNCLQSYSGVTGTIQSFNYDQAVTFSRSTPGYFNNLNYAICIKREPGYCTITYTNIGPNGVVYPFQLANFDDDGTPSFPAGQAGAGVINCPDDYIVINGIRLCGDRLNDGSITDNFSTNAPVTDTSRGPIVIPVRTNAGSTSRGFKLFYTQNRCPTSGTSGGTPNPRI